MHTRRSEVHARFRSHTGGQNSHVYPALARVPRDLFGVCVVGTSGRSGSGCSSLFRRTKEEKMTTYDTATRLTAPPTWTRYLLGVCLILAGLFVLGDVAAATIISTIVIGAVAVVAGVIEIVNAFWTRKWGAFLWQILLGILYVAFGAALFSQPVSSALILTYFLGLLLLMSGIVRLLLSFSHWREAGWLMLLSGAFGVVAGLIVLTGFPKTGLWVLGLVLGIDLISHGAAWLTYAWLPTGNRAT